MCEREKDKTELNQIYKFLQNIYSLCKISHIHTATFKFYRYKWKHTVKIPKISCIIIKNENEIFL